MGFWTNLIIVAHVLIALGIIGLVLLQHGKGADMGSGFGGGASSSLFGATGSANFLSRATAVLATLFFLLSLVLAYIATNQPREGGSVVERLQRAAPEQKKDEKKEEKKDAKKEAVVPSGEGAKDKTVPQ